MDDDPVTVRKFVARVHRTVINFSRNNLERFKVEFQYNKHLDCDVNAWVEFAVKNKVKKVCLRLNSVDDYHRLPQIMYCNSSLTELAVRGCNLTPRRTIEWPYLTELTLDDVLLHQNVIEKILSGCPVLRSLFLRNCQAFNLLKLNSSNVNKLEVRDCEDADRPLLEISAPFVRSLDIRLSRMGRVLRVTNFPAVVRAYIDVNDIDYDNTLKELIMSNTKELLEIVRHVKELEVGLAYTEFLSKLVVNGWPLPQSRRRCLKVYAYCEEESFPGILGLLGSSPNLETLVIEGVDYMCDGEPVTLSSAVKGDLNCDLLHLKSVRIVYYAGELMLKLAQILLKRAVALEEMVIGVDPTEPNNLSNIAQTLRSYPRSSQKNRVRVRLNM